jgi:hypothetical protein
MGSSDPLPAGFEIQFRSMNFQATGNSYLMHTNRDELHPWRSIGPGPIPATPATNAPAPAQADTSALTVLWPVLVPGANGMTTGRVHCDTKRRARQLDGGTHRGACGCRAAVPLRDAQRSGGLRFTHQH